MRREGEIAQKLKQVTFRHLKDALQENFKKDPHTCRYNKEGPFSCHICGHPDRTEQVICDSDDPFCLVQARHCPLWEPLASKDEIKQNFKSLMGGKISAIAAKYPDIAALKWALMESDGDTPTQDGTFEEVEKALEQETPAKDVPPPEKQSFWARVWASFKRYWQL